MLDIYIGASLAGRSGALVDTASSPVATAVAKQLDAIEPFWKDGYPESLEVVVLAERLGVLLDHPCQLLSHPPAAPRTAGAPLTAHAFPCELAQFRACP